MHVQKSVIHQHHRCTLSPQFRQASAPADDQEDEDEWLCFTIPGPLDRLHLCGEGTAECRRNHGTLPARNTNAS